MPQCRASLAAAVNPGLCGSRHTGWFFTFWGRTDSSAGIETNRTQTFKSKPILHTDYSTAPEVRPVTQESLSHWVLPLLGSPVLSLSQSILVPFCMPAHFQKEGEKRAQPRRAQSMRAQFPTPLGIHRCRPKPPLCHGRLTCTPNTVS